MYFLIFFFNLPELWKKVSFPSATYFSCLEQSLLIYNLHWKMWVGLGFVGLAVFLLSFPFIWECRCKELRIQPGRNWWKGRDKCATGRGQWKYQYLSWLGRGYCSLQLCWGTTGKWQKWSCFISSCSWQCSHRQLAKLEGRKTRKYEHRWQVSTFCDKERSIGGTMGEANKMQSAVSLWSTE